MLPGTHVQGFKNICYQGPISGDYFKYMLPGTHFPGFKNICYQGPISKAFSPKVAILRGKKNPGGAAQTVAKGLVYQKVAILRGKNPPGGAAQTVAKGLVYPGPGPGPSTRAS